MADDTREPFMVIPSNADPATMEPALRARLGQMNLAEGVIMQVGRQLARLGVNPYAWLSALQTVFVHSVVRLMSEAAAVATMQKLLDDMPDLYGLIRREDAKDMESRRDLN